jgi:uncharacterized UBP type Zn finger protein
MAPACSHLDLIAVTNTGIRVCEDCVKLRDEWVHLRMCLVCGHVGCCDSSRNRHAMRHFHGTGHPLVRSIEPGERWVWCYADQVMPGELPK